MILNIANSASWQTPPSEKSYCSKNKTTMLSSNSGWSSSGALSSFTLSGITNSRNYRKETGSDSSSDVKLLQDSSGESSRMESESPSQSLNSKTHPNGYNISEQTFALNFHVESCMDSDNDDDDSNEDSHPLNGSSPGAGEKRDSFLRPPGHEAWWNWDNIGDLHPAHTKPLFYSVQEESETLQSVAAKFKITPTELKRLNRLSEDFIFVGQKLRIRN